jgi:DNA transformation protein and related proteins
LDVEFKFEVKQNLKGLDMGEKGSKLSKDSALTAEYLVSKLESIGHITSKKMFGGYGIFHEDRMFAMVNSKGQPFLKVDAQLQSDLEAMGATQHAKMPYYSIPARILEESESLTKWARAAITASKQ